MNKAYYRRSMAAVLIVLIYIVASTAFAKQFPFAVLQDLSNSNSKRRIVYDAVEAAALIPFAAVYVHAASFGRGRWIPWAAIGVCAALVAILLPERLYAFLFYFIAVGCGEEFVFRGYLHNELRKTFDFKISVILGGLVFGFAHGYSHYMIQGGTITDILSEFGGGIVGALLFSAIYEKSGSIGWPILFHTCLDFAGYLI